MARTRKSHQYRKTEQQKKTVSQSSLNVHNSTSTSTSSNSNGIYLKGSYSSLCLCNICSDYKKHSEMFKGSECNHSFCSDCISKHVAAQIQQNNLKVNCPEFNCGKELNPKILQSILPKEVFDRWETVRCESLIAVGIKTYCPYKNCSVLMVDDGGEVVTRAECPSCHRLFCAQCLVPWHAGMNCKQFNKSIMPKEEQVLESKFLELAKRRKWQRCPKCKFYVQSSGGCEHMKCRCGCNFCYICGKDWDYGHICQMDPVDICQTDPVDIYQMDPVDPDYDGKFKFNVACFIFLLCAILVFGGIWLNWELFVWENPRVQFFTIYIGVVLLLSPV